MKNMKHRKYTAVFNNDHQEEYFYSIHKAGSHENRMDLEKDLARSYGWAHARELMQWVGAIVRSIED